MVAINIDFRRVRCFGGSQNHAFEELGTQLQRWSPAQRIQSFNERALARTQVWNVLCSSLASRKRVAGEMKHFFDNLAGVHHSHCRHCESGRISPLCLRTGRL